MRALLRIFLSLNTAVSVFTAFILIAFIGSLSLVRNLAFFSGVDEIPLFQWLAASGAPGKTWWIYALIVALGLLAVNTLFCTAEGVLKRLGSNRLLLQLSPQIMHIGVLFIMLGHLLTASVGFKADLNIARGEKQQVTDKISLTVEEISVRTDPNGYYTDWEARIVWLEDGQRRHEGTLRPVHPLYVGQFGLYVNAVTLEPQPAVLVRVCRDPGARWAFLGGLIFSFGGLALIYGRAGRDTLAGPGSPLPKA